MQQSHILQNKSSKLPPSSVPEFSSLIHLRVSVLFHSQMPDQTQSFYSVTPQFHRIVVSQSYHRQLCFPPKPLNFQKKMVCLIFYSFKKLCISCLGFFLLYLTRMCCFLFIIIVSVMYNISFTDTFMYIVQSTSYKQQRHNLIEILKSRYI